MEGTSLIPPNAPIPDPPGAYFFMQLPVFIVGLSFAIALGFMLTNEFIDRFLGGAGEAREEDPENFILDLPTLIHPDANDPQKCVICHFATREEESVSIFGTEVNREELPESLESWMLDEDHFREIHGLPPRSPEKRSSAFAPRVGPFRGTQVCMECHSYENFDEKHGGHIFPPLRDCTLCHDLHFSYRESLLNATHRELCSTCHDPDN